MPQRVSPAYIAKRAKALGLDPRAVLAVAAQEGLGGGVGDNNTSFGPFQLHYGGAYPSSAPRGAGASQAWAWSPQGVEYALRQIASVAGGQRGGQAVKSIVTKFERPADPNREIRGALSAYGKTSAPGPARGAFPSGAAASGQATNPVSAAPDNSVAPAPSVALALLAQVGKKTPDYSDVFRALQQRSEAPAPSPMQAPTPTPQHPIASPGRGRATPGSSVSLGGQVNGLDAGFTRALEQAVAAAGGTKIRVDSGYRSPAHNAAVGGVPRSNHTTGEAADGSAYVPGKGWVPLGVLLQTVAARYGLRSGNVPGFYRGGRDPVHVDDGANVRGRR